MATCDSRPSNYKELINLHHSLARKVIERTFGLLKKRCAILRTASFFDVKTQVRNINSCYVLHNYVLHEQREWDVALLNEVDVELASATTVGDVVIQMR